jgi:hypothetical protein
MKVKIVSFQHFFNTVKRRTNGVIKSSKNAKEAIERIGKEVINETIYDFPINEYLNSNDEYVYKAKELFEYALESIATAFPFQSWDEDDDCPGDEWKKKKP